MKFNLKKNTAKYYLGDKQIYARLCLEEELLTGTSWSLQQNNQVSLVSSYYVCVVLSGSHSPETAAAPFFIAAKLTLRRKSSAIF